MEGKQSATDRIRHRTVLDMLRDDQASGSKKSWRAFRDKLRLKRAGAAWTSSVPIPASDLPIQTNRKMTRRGSARYPSDATVEEVEGEASGPLGQMIERQRSTRLLPLETDPEEENENKSPDGEQKQAAPEGNLQPQMSLMTLLEDDGSNFIGDEGENEAEAEAEEDEEDLGDCNICCACRAKHKGTAFGPCGHTFCKNCTKELHVSRGNCPACNNFILEILDIY